MNSMKRYQVIFYDRLIGIDDGMDYEHKADAVKEARRYRRGVRDLYGDPAKWDGAAVFDKENETATVIYGNPYNFRAAFCDYVTVKTMRGEVIT